MSELSSFVRTDHKSVEKSEPLHAIKSWLTGDSKKCPIIVDDGRVVGIVNERALMSSHRDLDAHVHHFALATRALREDATLEEARAKMAEFRAAYLPVEDTKGKLKGYVRAIDIGRASLDGRAAREVAVPVTHLRASQTMGEALRAFHQEYVEWLPVVGQDGKLGGVLSRAQMMRVGFGDTDRGRGDVRSEKRTMLDERVDGFMDGTTSVLSPTANASAVFDALENNGYAIVGPRDGAPEGVVTAETLFRAGPPGA